MGAVNAVKRQGVSLAAITVKTADGEPVKLGDVVDRPTVLVIPRYYGCLPCRDYLHRLSERLADVQAAGGAALGVSVGADYQARWLMAEQGVGFPLLVDPERGVHAALELPRRWWVSLNPRGWWNYLRALRRGNRQGRIIDPNQLPGLAVLDDEARAVWVHRGHALGDYPPIERVLSELDAAPKQDERRRPGTHPLTAASCSPHRHSTRPTTGPRENGER